MEEYGKIWIQRQINGNEKWRKIMEYATKILIADENAETRKNYKAALERSGFGSVTEAHNG